jgi:hypothetical protein
MLNRPWIDPRDVDWTDALNPLRIPGLAQNNNPFDYAALKDPIFQALRQAKGIQQRIYVSPDPQNQLIQPGSTFDFEVPSEPNCWLWALNASGDQSDFLFNITDSHTGSTIFSSPVSMSAVNAQRTGTTGRGPQFFLSTPHLYAPPSYPVVRIINTAGSAQNCRVTLFTSVEYDL